MTAWPGKKAGLELHCAGPPSRVVQRSGLEPPAGGVAVPVPRASGGESGRLDCPPTRRVSASAPNKRVRRGDRPASPTICAIFLCCKIFYALDLRSKYRDHHIPRASTTCRPQLNGTIGPPRSVRGDATRANPSESRGRKANRATASAARRTRQAGWVAERTSHRGLPPCRSGLIADDRRLPPRIAAAPCWASSSF